MESEQVNDDSTDGVWSKNRIRLEARGYTPIQRYGHGHHELSPHVGMSTRGDDARHVVGCMRTCVETGCGLVWRRGAYLPWRKVLVRKAFEQLFSMNPPA